MTKIENLHTEETGRASNKPRGKADSNSITYVESQDAIRTPPRRVLRIFDMNNDVKEK